MRTLFILFLLFCYSVGYTQDDWDLEKCINYALNNSVEVAQGGVSVKTAQTSTKEALHQRYPNFSANSSLRWNFGRAIDPTSNDFITSTFFSNGYSLNSNVTLFNGGRLKKSIDQSKWEEEATRADLDNTRTNITLNLIRAYFEILFAQDAHRNNQIQLKTIIDQIEQMNKMVNAGTRAQFEIYDLEAQRATSEQLLTQSQNRIDLAYLNLKGVMNLPLDFDMTIVSPAAEQEVVTSLETVSIDEVVEKAKAFMPWSRAFDYRLMSAETQVDIARSGYYPSVFFGGGLSTNFSNQARKQDGFTIGEFSTTARINGVPSTIVADQIIPTFSKIPFTDQIDRNFSYGFGFQLQFPIYNNYGVKASVERAKLNIENLSLEKEKTLITLKNTMGQILTDARAAKRSLEAAERTLKAREVAFENAEKRFGLGAINSYEYIGIQDQLSQARTELIIAKYDYLFKSKLLDYYQGYPVNLTTN